MFANHCLAKGDTKITLGTGASILTNINNDYLVKDNLVNLIAKIGEKITIRRTNFFDNSTGSNYFYVHSAIEKNIGKIISIVKLEGMTDGENQDLGSKIAMHIAASNPLAIEKEGIDKTIVNILKML